MSDGGDIKKTLVMKALTDGKFKAELLKNAGAAIEKAAGVKIPAGMTVKVLEDSAAVVHLVLPAATVKGGELNEAQLGAVAGGAVSNTFIVYPGCDSTALCHP